MEDIVIALIYLITLFVWGILLLYFISNNEWIVVIKMISMFIIGFLVSKIINE